MAGWIVSPILKPLIDEVRRAHPGMVIGTIGDAAHSAEASGSDHNPDRWGFVCAADFMLGTPANPSSFTAAEAEYLFDRIRALEDSRTAYAIYDRRIESRTVSPWTVRAYDGTDPHTNHVHVSVVHGSDPHPTDSWDIYPEAPLTTLTSGDVALIVDGLNTALRTATPYAEINKAISWQYAGNGLQGATTTLDALSDSQGIAAAVSALPAPLAASLTTAVTDAVNAALAGAGTALTKADVEESVIDALERVTILVKPNA